MSFFSPRCWSIGILQDSPGFFNCELTNELSDEQVGCLKRWVPIPSASFPSSWHVDPIWLELISAIAFQNVN